MASVWISCLHGEQKLAGHLTYGAALAEYERLLDLAGKQGCKVTKDGIVSIVEWEIADREGCNRHLLYVEAESPPSSPEIGQPKWCKVNNLKGATVGRLILKLKTGLVTLSK